MSNLISALSNLVVGHLTRAELGNTDNPRELVPGHPAAIHVVADRLADHRDTFEDIGNGLGKVHIPQWSGTSSDAFWESFSLMKPRWLTASDYFGEASRALRDYAETLAWAQSQAQEAIDLWDRGERLSQTGHAIPPYAHETTRMPVDDPGAELRAHAETLLAEAREQLQELGDAAANRIGAVAGFGADAPSWLENAAHLVRAHADGIEYKSSRDVWDGVNESTKGRGQKLQLFTETWDESAWGIDDTQQSGSRARHDELDFVGTDGKVNAGLDGQGRPYVEAESNNYLARLRSTETVDHGWFSYESKEEASVGAFVEGTTDADKGKVEWSAFTGAKVENESKVQVFGLEAGLKTEGWAGFGQSSGGGASRGDDGSFHLGGQFGAGRWVGGKVGVEIGYDPTR